MTGVLSLGERPPSDPGDADLAGDDLDAEGLLDDPDAFDLPPVDDASPLEDDDEYIDTSIHDDDEPPEEEWDGNAD
jgi:hypothetical protein